jgi:Kef-type K+ transport system membrane component KefB
METHLVDPVLQFTVLVVAALAVQLTVERVHLPGLIGLLLLGMVLGPAGAGVLADGPVVPVLGEIGLIYVMFIAGLEIDLRLVREHRRTVVTFGLLAFAFAAVPTAVGARILGLDLAAAALVGALVSSHTLLAYPILMRYGLLRRLPVVVAVGGTLITDTLALVALAVALGVHRADAGALGWMLPLAAFCLLAACAMLVVPWLSRRLFGREDVTQAEKALFVLAVLMTLATAAGLTGTDEILGAFLAGVALNRVLEARDSLREHVEFVGRMLFIPFFFVWTGTLLDFSVLAGGTAVWVIAGALLGAVLVGKLAAAWIIGALFGFSGSERSLMAALTIPQAAATLAVTITARDAGLFDNVMVDAVIILILITCIAGPVLTAHIGRRVAESPADVGASTRQRALKAPVDEQPSP